MRFNRDLLLLNSYGPCAAGLRQSRRQMKDLHESPQPPVQGSSILLEYEIADLRVHSGEPSLATPQTLLTAAS